MDVAVSEIFALITSNGSELPRNFSNASLILLMPSPTCSMIVTTDVIAFAVFEIATLRESSTRSANVALVHIHGWSAENNDL